MMRYTIRATNGGALGAAAPRVAARGIGGREIETRSRRREDSRQYESQLAAIRKLMRRAVARGAWLTLNEIAKATEFGEASISAQLRHLRKKEHGGYRVQKRRRKQLCLRDASARRRRRDEERAPIVWEYRVLRPR